MPSSLFLVSGAKPEMRHEKLARQIFWHVRYLFVWQQTSWYDMIDMIGTYRNLWQFHVLSSVNIRPICFDLRPSMVFLDVFDGRKLGWSGMIDGGEPCWQLFLLPIFEEDLRTGSACLCIRLNVNLAKANILRIPNDTKICKKMQTQ
jgi:hypothetical protein